MNRKEKEFKLRNHNFGLPEYEDIDHCYKAFETYNDLEYKISQRLKKKLDAHQEIYDRTLNAGAISRFLYGKDQYKNGAVGGLIFGFTIGLVFASFF